MGAVGEGGVRVLNDEVLAPVRRDAVRARGGGAGRAARGEPTGAPGSVRDAHRCRWPDASRSSSTTASPRARPCARPARSPALTAPRASWSPCRWPRGRRSSSCAGRGRGGRAVGAAVVLERGPVVRRLRPGLRRRRSRACWPRARAAGGSGRVQARQVAVPAGDVELAASLAVPPSARGVVAFAHGSGSSRHSPRNRYVADAAERRAPRHAAARPAHARGGRTSRPRLRRPAAERAAAARRAAGWPTTRAREDCRSACSEPAPARRPRSRRRPTRRPRCRRW